MTLGEDTILSQEVPVVGSVRRGESLTEWERGRQAVISSLLLFPLLQPPLHTVASPWHVIDVVFGTFCIFTSQKDTDVLGQYGGTSTRIQLGRSLGSTIYHCVTCQSLLSPLSPFPHLYNWDLNSIYLIRLMWRWRQPAGHYPVLYKWTLFFQTWDWLKVVMWVFFL